MFTKKKIHLRITAENLNKFHYQTDNATLFNNAHGVVTELLSDHKVTANIKVVADRIKEVGKSNFIFFSNKVHRLMYRSHLYMYLVDRLQ